MRFHFRLSWLSRIPLQVIGAFIFGVIGVVLLVVSHAATQTASFEAENGTQAGSISVAADSSASNSQVIRFGAAQQTRTLNCVPAVSATMTNAVSHLCGYPDATNTGPVSGTTFTDLSGGSSSGSGWSWNGSILTITGDNTVINGFRVNGSVNVQADNVTVENTIVHNGGTSWGIGLMHATGATIKNVTVYGDNGTTNRIEYGIKDVYGDASDIHIIAANIYHIESGIGLGDGSITGSYLHDFGYISGDHTNGIYVGGGGTASLLMQNNTIFNQQDQTDCIALFQDFGNEVNKTITGNLFAGGGYVLYAGGGSSVPNHIVITNNHFSRLFFANSGSYGPATAWSSAGTGNTWSGNVWDDTGATINM